MSMCLGNKNRNTWILRVECVNNRNLHNNALHEHDIDFISALIFIIIKIRMFKYINDSKSAPFAIIQKTELL